MNPTLGVCTNPAPKRVPKRLSFLNLVIVLGVAWSAGCRKSDTHESHSQGRIGCLIMQASRVVPVPKQPSVVVDRFKQMLASNTAKLAAQRSPPADVMKHFAANLLDSLRQHPLPRSQALSAVDQLLTDMRLSCGQEPCSQALETGELGAISIFETLRLQQLQALEKGAGDDATGMLLSLRSLIDDRVGLSPQSALFKARVVGGAEPPLKEISQAQIEFLSRAEVNEMELSFLKSYSLASSTAARIRAASAVPAAGSLEVIYPEGTKRPAASTVASQMAAELVNLLQRMPKATGTVYRAVRGAPRELLKDLERRAAKQRSTGLYFYGQGALTSSTRSRNFANGWFSDQEEGGAARGELSDSLLLVINQKSGVSIERYLADPNLDFSSMQEVLLPPLLSYKVVRFEDRSDAGLTTRDPRWPEATHVAYLIEQ